MFKMSCSQCGEMYLIGEGCPCWKKPKANLYNTTFVTNPEPVGYWVLYEEGPSRTMFSMYHKPTEEQIKNTEQLLGWKWKDKI